MHIEGHINWTNSTANFLTTGTLGCGAITSTGAIADGAASTFTTGTTIGTLTLADGSITDSGGSISFGNETLSTSNAITAGTLSISTGSVVDSGGAISFGNENISTTGTASFGATTVDTLTIDNSDQDYLVTSRVNLTFAIQGQKSATNSYLEVYTKDGDGTDSAYLSLIGLGLPGDITNFEGLTLGCTPTSCLIYSSAVGAGSVLPVSIYTSGNTTQLVLNTDNSINMSGDLNLTAGTLYIAGALAHYGDVGADTYISFLEDQYFFMAGGLEYLRFVESAKSQDYIVFNDDGNDIDFRVEATGQANALFVQGSDGKVGVRDAAPGSVFDVTGDINTTESYKVDDTQVVTNQQAHIADATTQDLAGTDSIDETKLESDLSGIVTTINSIISALETHGLLASA